MAKEEVSMHKITLTFGESNIRQKIAEAMTKAELHAKVMKMRSDADVLDQLHNPLFCGESTDEVL